MTFNLTRLYNIHILLLALMTYFIPYTSFANCHVSGHADIHVDKMYITDGQETLADLLSPADVHKVTEAMSKVTCDKSPIYVNVAGDSTSFFKFSDDQFTYDSIEDSIGAGALVNKLSISVLAKGQAPGAQAFDLYISDDKSAKKWDPTVADVLQLRAEYIITDWTPAICSVTAPSTITLPSASPGDSVMASLAINIECDKAPNTFMAGIVIPSDVISKTTDGIIYDRNDIKITLQDASSNPVTLNTLSDVKLSTDNTATISYIVHSDIGKGAPSGEYGTSLTYTIYHN